MATWYVDSTATGGSGVGTSWANACLTMAAAIALSAAGDDFNVYSGHAETQASTLALTFKGTPASPNRIFSCDRTNTPAQASDLLAGASITTTGNTSLSIAGTIYCYGVTFSAGSGTTGTTATLTPQSSTGAQFYESCTFIQGTTTVTNSITLGTTVTNTTGGLHFSKCRFTLNGSAGSGVVLASNNLAVENCTFSVPNASVTTLFSIPRPTFARFIGCDLTTVASGKGLLVSPTPTWVQFIDCKLTAGAVVTTPTQPFSYIDQIAAGVAQRAMYQGTLTTETTVVRSGGSPQSWKLVTTANNKRQMPFECFETLIYCAAGSPVTVNLNCITDLATDATALTNADIWMEAQVLDNASFPISDLHTTAPATQLTAGSTLTSGATSGSWTTTGMTTPDARSATLTFTPQIAGYVRITVKVARASLSTLRVDFDPSV